MDNPVLQNERTSGRGLHNRRVRRSHVTAASGGALSADAGTLAPWTPSGDDTWDRAKAAHLLRRATFGVEPGHLIEVLNQGPEATVDALLQQTEAPEEPGSWVSQQPFSAPDNADRQRYRIWARELQEWWFDLMRDSRSGLREKMTLFWHNHFTSEFLTVYVTQYFYIQNQLFREYSFGNFKELTEKITVDPCMLVYLDLGLSIAGNPNENYPRELLELFTIGEGEYSDGTPHYTEHDIVELSRALTGWVVDGLGHTFRSSRFDSGEKTIFGETANFGLGTVGDRDVLDLIFDQQDADLGEKRAAVFLCSKLYRWFVYDIPSPEIVAGMASTLVQNDWELRPVLRQLLLSEHFFSEEVRGAMIKSPADFTAGAVTTLGLDPSLSATGSIAGRPETHDPVTAMQSLAMSLFSPPNVKGWPGGRNWISSVTVPQRIKYSDTWLLPYTGSKDYGFDPSTLLQIIPSNDDVYEVLDFMIDLGLPFGVSEQAYEQLLNTLLGGGKDYEWDPGHPSTGQRVRSTLIELARLAEFQLM